MAPEGLLQLSGATFIEYYAIFSEVKRIIVFLSFLPVHRRRQIFHAVVRDDDAFDF